MLSWAVGLVGSGRRSAAAVDEEARRCLGRRAGRFRGLVNEHQRRNKMGSGDVAVSWMSSWLCVSRKSQGGWGDTREGLEMAEGELGGEVRWVSAARRARGAGQGLWQGSEAQWDQGLCPLGSDSSWAIEAWEENLSVEAFGLCFPQGCAQTLALVLPHPNPGFSQHQGPWPRSPWSHSLQ